MILVDVHAHLDMDDFNDIDKVVESAKNQGVKFIVANGLNKESNRKILEISEKYDIVKASLGVYPNEAIDMKDSEFAEELKFIEKNKPIAIGEIGLDYKEEVDKNKMKDCFEKQIKLAKKLNVPVIVHSRKAELEAIEILEKSGHKKIIMHCFSGKKKFIKRISDNGWYFSVPCIVAYSQQFQDLVKEVPVTQLLTETDSPFMSPYPNVKRNEPAFVIESLQKIAELKGLNLQETSNQIFMNFQKLFL